MKLDGATETLPLIGAKEGIGHIALAFLDPGDVALVPDPAYPVYGVGTMFAGAQSYAMPLVGGERMAAGPGGHTPGGCPGRQAHVAQLPQQPHVGHCHR